MSDENGVLKNLLKTELASINRGIVKKRKSLEKLLENPVLEEGDTTIELEKSILEKISKKLTSPSSEILFPITIYLIPGTSEGYIRGEREAKTADELGADGISRGDKYWLQKYRAKSLSHKYPGLFQIFYIV